jgi:hypothetical protein
MTRRLDYRDSVLKAYPEVYTPAALEALEVLAPLNRDQLVMLEEGNVGDPGPADTMFDLKHPPLEFRQD